MLCDHCRTELEHCVPAGLLTRAQWDAICARTISTPAREDSREERKGFNPIMALYYAGALMILSAFGWFLGSHWNDLGPAGVLVVSSGYAALFATIGRYLLKAENYPVAGGLLVTCAVGMAPLVTWALESVLGLWPSDAPGAYHSYYTRVNVSWIVIELATVAAALFAARKVKFSFLAMPAAIALWFFSMDAVEIVLQDHLAWGLRGWVSAASGLAFLAAGREIERRSEGVDYPFWIYLAGLLAFWGGLASQEVMGTLVGCGINVGLVALGLYLDRRTFAVFGAAGIYWYVGKLAFDVFKDSPLFPVALAFLGLMVILSTVLFQKSYSRLQGWVRPAYP